MGAVTRWLKKLPLLREWALMHENSQRLLKETEYLRELRAEEFTREFLATTRGNDPLRLFRAERQVFSQNGEDGAIAEIFRRIGTTNRMFVEFGVDDGLVNNTLFLLLQGWKGFWLEGNARNAASIQKTFAGPLKTGALKLRPAFVTAENIRDLFQSLGVPLEIDLLSIDIDGNDYWAWKALEPFRPRVVVIEYNALFPPDVKWVKKYDPRSRWDGTTNHGASLKSLELLAAAKGYALVGCNLSGINACFVRSDLCATRFHPHATAENHYEPARHFLVRRNGHPRGFGEFESV